MNPSAQSEHPVETWEGEGPGEAPLSPLQLALAGTVPEYLTTMPVQTTQQKIDLYQALNGSHVPIKDLLNLPMEIVGFIVRPSGPQVGQEGEVFYYPITILILSDGRCVRSGSKGIVQAIRQLAWAKGPAPWNPPIKVIARARPLGDGQNWYTLEVLS